MFPGSPELRTNQNWLYSETRLVRTLGYNVCFPNDEHRTLDKSHLG